MKPMWKNASCVALVLCLVAAGASRAQEKRFKAGRHGKATLEFVQNIPVLKVYGTPEEMGEQAGTLLGKSGTAVVREYLGKFLIGPLRNLVLDQARKMEGRFPYAYHREMKAFAEASGLGYEDVLLLNTFGDIKKVIRCTTIAVSTEKSADRTPMFGRNFDFPPLGIAQHYGLVVVYHPRGKKAFASVTYPGLVGTHSFLNEDGLAGAVMEVHAGRPRFSAKAMPALMLYRHIAESVDTVEAGLKIVEEGPRCSANNLMLMEASGKAALAEFTVKAFAVRRPVDGLLFGTNHHRSRELGRNPRCWRMNILLRRVKAEDFTWNLAGIKSLLEETAQGPINLSSMVFLPGKRALHLAMGKVPAAQGPYVLLDRKCLFSRPPARKKI